MVKARWALVSLIFPFVTISQAQTAPAKTDAEAAAAMERAQRMANNPMRVILEAGKILRRKAVAEPEGEAGDASNLRRTAVRTEAAPAVARTTVAPAAPVAAAAVAPAAAPPEPTTPLATPIDVFLTTRGEAAPSRSAALPALEASGMSTSVAPLPKTAPPLAALAATLVQPKLLITVEPAFPSRLVDDAARLSTVSAELSLRTDGSVAEANVLTPLSLGLRRAIVGALEQWRFAPLAAPRQHVVELVFNNQK